MKMGSLRRVDHIDPGLQDLPVDRAGGLRDRVALRINKVGRRQGVRAIGDGGVGICIVEHRERIALLCNELLGAVQRFPAAGHVDHQKLDFTAQFLVLA